MKHLYLFLLFLTCSSLYIKGQSIQFGSENEKKNELTKSKVIMVSQEGYWVLNSGETSALTLMNSNYYIEYYDNKMIRQSKKKIECPIVNGNIYEMDYLIVYQNNIHLLSSFEDKEKKETFFKIFKLENDGGINPNIINEWSLLGKNYDKNVVYSSDSSSYAVVVSIIDSRDTKILTGPGISIDKKALSQPFIFSYWVFRNENEIYSIKNREINYDGLKFMPTNFFLSQSNDLLITIDYELKKTEENKKLLKKKDLWKVNASSLKLEKITLSPTNNYFFNWKINWTKENDMLDLIGSYNMVDEQNTIGVFFMSLSLNPLSITRSITTVLPKNIFDNVYGLYKNKNYLLNFSLEHVFDFNNGSKLLILEYTNSAIFHRNVTNTTSAAVGGNNNPGIEYSDMVFINLDNNGTIFWSDVIRKNHLTYGHYKRSTDQKYFKSYLDYIPYTDFAFSYIAVLSNNTVSVYFQDSRFRKEKELRTYSPTLSDRNLDGTVILKCNFNEKGYVESKIVYDQNKEGFVWGTSLYFNSKNGLYVYTENKKLSRWLKLTY